MRETGEAPPYVVVRFENDPEAGVGHDHVISIETRDPDGGTTSWQAVDVISALKEGERFVVEGTDGVEGILEPALCPSCPLATVKVGRAPDEPGAGE